MMAWHFVGDTLRDGRPIPADGEWLIHEGDAVMCVSGLHASRDPFDALKYAPGATLCLVECEDIVSQQNDKLVCRRRMIVKRIDATDLMWRAAREYAKSVLHLWNAPQVVRDFLETGDESLRAAAEAAALDAARAAWDAAGAAGAAALDAARAAWDAAGDAALAAAWAAWDAAWAAWDAAGDAAGAAARAAARAAWAAAGDARAAAGDAQRKIFNDLVAEAFA